MDNKHKSAHVVEGSPGDDRSWWARNLRRLLDASGKPPVRIVLWNGEEVTPSDTVVHHTMHVHNRSALLKLLVHPDLYFGEGYMHGAIDVEGDLVSFLEDVYRGRAKRTHNPLERLAYAVQGWRNKNSLSGSRANIHHHYDIGNSFYQLWLDREAMQYTCAYYPTADTSLETAQLAKLDHVCRKLQLKPGMTVVEAGCGWGGLARHMARHYGVTVKAYNISHEQIKFAREKAQTEGLQDRVEYILDDYRTIKGQYDVFVSVGMLEHVGPEHYYHLSEVIRRSLKPTGRGLIHTIGRNRAGPMNAWINKRIFPGAKPPSMREMLDIFEPNQFSILDVENLRLHYACTLRDWLQRFEQHLDVIREEFDETFVRAWRLYLAGSEAAFSSGQLQLFQILFSHNRHNDIPLTRQYLYHDH